MTRHNRSPHLVLTLILLCLGGQIFLMATIMERTETMGYTFPFLILTMAWAFTMEVETHTHSGPPSHTHPSLTPNLLPPDLARVAQNLIRLGTALRILLPTGVMVALVLFVPEPPAVVTNALFVFCFGTAFGTQPLILRLWKRHQNQRPEHNSRLACAQIRRFLDTQNSLSTVTRCLVEMKTHNTLTIVRAQPVNAQVTEQGLTDPAQRKAWDNIVLTLNTGRPVLLEHIRDHFQRGEHPDLPFGLMATPHKHKRHHEEGLFSFVLTSDGTRHHTVSAERELQRHL